MAEGFAGVVGAVLLLHEPGVFGSREAARARRMLWGFGAGPLSGSETLLNHGVSVEVGFLGSLAHGFGVSEPPASDSLR